MTSLRSEYEKIKALNHKDFKKVIAIVEATAISTGCVIHSYKTENGDAISCVCDNEAILFSYIYHCISMNANEADLAFISAQGQANVATAYMQYIRHKIILDTATLFLQRD